MPDVFVIWTLSPIFHVELKLHYRGPSESIDVIHHHLSLNLSLSEIMRRGSRNQRLWSALRESESARVIEYLARRMLDLA